MTDTIGQRIRQARTERGLSQQQLADLIYMSRVAVTHWEIGYSVPDVGLLVRLCHALDVSADWLLADELTPLRVHGRRAPVHRCDRPECADLNRVYWRRRDRRRRAAARAKLEAAE